MFKIGDKVKIFCKIPDYYNGWDNTWYSPRMDRYVDNGRVYTISTIEPQGTRFKEDGLYGWPPEALELVENYIEPTKEEKLMKKISKLYKKCPTTSHWDVSHV